MRKKTKVDIVYEYLINELVSLNYRAGDRMVINQIAEACSVSEIPVREALRRLESNGYVRIVPNQGAIAIGLEKGTIADIVQVKGVLEGFATRLSIDYLSANDIAHLRSINLKLKEAADAHDYTLSSALNKEFHLLIYERIPQAELAKLIRDLWEKWSVTQHIFSVSPVIMQESYQEHEKILELMEKRCYTEVEQLVREHKFKAMKSWMEAPIR